MNPDREKYSLPVLALLLVVGCRVQACPSDRPHGMMTVLGDEDFLLVGTEAAEFQCDVKQCVWSEPCDRRNVTFTWSWTPTNGKRSGEVKVPESDLIYPTEGPDCRDCVRYRNTSLPLETGIMTVYSYMLLSNSTGAPIKCYMAHVSINIGYMKPSVPDKDLTCIAKDWEELKCQWCPQGQGSEDNWKFDYKLYSDENASECKRVPKDETCDPGESCCLKGCTATMNFGLWHRSLPYNITIRRSNGYGTTIDTFERRFGESTIETSPVTNLTILDTQKRSLTIGWHCPHFSLNQVHLKYQINISSILGDEMHFYTEDGNISTRKCDNITDVYVQLLENLSPYVRYTITVRARANLSKHWSETRTTRQYTDEDVPARNPLTRGSSYRHILQADSLWTIKLYYQDIPLRYVGGELEKVIVEEIGSGAWRSQCSMKERECTITNLRKDRQYEFVISGETSLGQGPATPTSRFLLSERDSGLPVPEYFAVETVSTDLQATTTKLNFTWIGPETNETVDYIVYYRACKNHGSCLGGVNWWVVPGNTSWFLTDLHHRQHTTNDYSFTMGIEDENERSQGMLDWTSCIYKADGGLSRAPAVPERAPESGQEYDSLLVTWQRQICARTDGRIVAYTLNVNEVELDGQPASDGYATNVTVPPSETSYLFLGLPPGSRYNVTLTSVLRRSIVTSQGVIMALRVPSGPDLWPLVLLPLVVVIVTIFVVLAYRRYRRIERSAHNFTRPEIDDPVRFVVSHDEDYLMPELTNGTMVADRTQSNTSSVSSENEGSEDKKLLPARNGAIRVPDRNSADSERTRYTTVAPVPNGHVPADQNGHVPADQNASNGTHPPVPPPGPVNHVPSRVPTKLVPVPLSSDEGDSDYCRFGEPSEPEPITVAAVHFTHQRPNLGRQPFDTTDKERQLKEIQRQEREPSLTPDSDYDYSKVGVAYLPRMSSTDSDIPETPRTVLARGSLPLISDENGYLVPNTVEPARPKSELVSNNTYGLEPSLRLSPAQSDEDVFESDQSTDGIRIDVADRGDAHIPDDYVPSSCVHARDVTPRPLADTPRGDTATPMPSMKGCDRPVSGPERSDSVSPRPSGSDVIPEARPVSYHDAGYASNDSLPKPKPSCESNGLSDVDEGYNGDKVPPSHDRESSPSPVSPPIQISSPGPPVDSPSTSMDYVTLDDIIMV